MISSSAPGKIILFGEHAVVYGYPALAIPVVEVQATTTIRERPNNKIIIEAPNIGLLKELSEFPSNHPLSTIVHAVLFTLGIDNPPGCIIHLESTIPIEAGMGSGAAVSVAMTRALSNFLNHPMTNEEVNEITFNIEKLFHGTPSGIDNTVITYMKPVYFIKEKLIETFTIGTPFTILIGNTGISAPTRLSVDDVREIWIKEKAWAEGIFVKIGDIARNARCAIEQGKIDELGELMNTNHALLRDLTVSSFELDQLVEAARRSGALGAKLSGGGRGGNMIALIKKENAQAIARSLKSAGAKRIIVTEVA